MLIAHQKFRSCMIGHYIRSCHIITSSHATHVKCGPNLFVHNENSAYVTPHVTTCAVTSYVHRRAHSCRQAGHPCINMVCQKLLMDMPCMPAKQYLSKLTASHFSTLNMKITNQNMPCTMRMRLIAMRTSGYVQRNLLHLCTSSRHQ